MQLDEHTTAILDAVTDLIVETEKRFDKQVEDVLRGKIEINEGIAAVRDGLTGLRVDVAQALDEVRGDLAKIVETASEKAGELVHDRIRQERLEVREALFNARKRFDDISAALEQKIATVKDGEPGESVKGEPGKDGLPGIDGITGEARGLYDPAETYGKLDRVSFNGSEWIARHDGPGALPGSGWMLGAQHGKRGKPGVGIQSLSVKDYSIALKLSDGSLQVIDLRGMFERYDQERGE